MFTCVHSRCMYSMCMFTCKYSKCIYSFCLLVLTPDAYVYLCVFQMYICTLYVCMYMFMCWIVYLLDCTYAGLCIVCMTCAINHQPIPNSSCWLSPESSSCDRQSATCEKVLCEVQEEELRSTESKPLHSCCSSF